MKWRPERGWWSLITRLGLGVGGSAVLITSIIQTTGAQVNGLQGQETQVVSEPPERQRDFVDLIEQVKRGEAPTGPRAAHKPTAPTKPEPAPRSEVVPVPPGASPRPAEPRSTSSAEPRPTQSAKPEPTRSVEPEPTVSVEPEPTPSTEPEPTLSTEPETARSAEPQPTPSDGEAASP